jgi:cysteine synthase
MKIANNITALIGNTPLVKLNKITEESKAEIAAKLEFFNPCGSIKDRTAFSMIKDAEDKKLINKDTLIIEPTSGNTGLGLAFICSQRGYKLLLVMPENVSAEKKKLLSFMGTEVILTSRKEGMKGAVKKAESIRKKNKNSFMPQQFKNPANPKIHSTTTAEEIWKDTQGKVDIVVCGVGTGGTITGISENLKKKKKTFKAVAVEPEKSAVLSGGKAGKHNIQGIGAGFIPEILNLNLIDEIITVKDKDAFDTTRALAEKEGILAGISSGAALNAALKIGKRKENKGKLIVVIFPDSGERYISMF